MYDPEGDIVITNGITGVDSNVIDAADRPVDDPLPAINCPNFPPRFPLDYPPTPRPAFLPTPSPHVYQPYQPQLDALKNRVKGFIQRAERNSANLEARVRRHHQKQNDHNAAMEQFMDIRLRELKRKADEMNLGLNEVQRKLNGFIDEVRASKRQATDEYNVLVSGMDELWRRSCSHYQAVDQRLAHLENNSRQYSNLEGSVTAAASEMRRLGDLVEKSSVSKGRRCMGCLASNYVCVSHVVDGVRHSNRRRHDSNDDDTESQYTEGSSFGGSERPSRGRQGRRSRTRH